MDMLINVKYTATLFASHLEKGFNKSIITPIYSLRLLFIKL